MVTEFGISKILMGCSEGKPTVDRRPRIHSGSLLCPVDGYTPTILPLISTAILPFLDTYVLARNSYT
jgi:hypothetical protein